ncbi:MAG: ATP-binding protein [Armatimonadetes bacterium]|nr:ATP-binding protein [Armatimonadota bacterium]
MTPRAAAAVYGLLAFIVVLSGLVSSARYEDEYVGVIRRQLQAATALKAEGLQRWRQERVSDITALIQNPVFQAEANGLAAGRTDSRAALRAWLGNYLRYQAYDRVELRDGAGRLLIACARPGAEPWDDAAALAAAATVEPALQDLHKHASGSVFMASSAAVAGGKRRCAVLLRMPADAFIYPYLHEWPAASRTAETLLVRREGDKVRFISGLRFGVGPAFQTRALAAAPDMPAARAALGHSGPIDGVDYRGHPVLAHTLQIPGSPWALVARVDKDEAYAPIRARRMGMAALIGALLLAGGAVLAWIRRLQAVALYRERLMGAEALRASEAKLRIRNAELQRIAYTISHDLKSPLVTVLTFVGFVRDDIANGNEERVRQDLDFISQGATRMSALLDALLHFTRVGALAPGAEPVSYAALIAEVVGALAGRIHDSGVDIRVAPADFTLYGDRVRLGEIWQNLIENSIKYMGERPDPTVWIEVEGSGPEARFSVRDNGIGVEPKLQQKVFDLFQKLDPATEGTGVGLAVVKRLVESYGGSAAFASQGAGLGAEVAFTLPLAWTTERAVDTPPDDQGAKRTS